MANSYFEFKQFKVEQSKVAMKVGTDGVLLGAWAGFDANPSSILDIGTGSGLIALMMAQRFTSALIHAVDIDSAACAQADDNFRLSPWSSRLSVSNKNISDVNLEDGKFDLIVCNPPFYSNAFKSVDNKRNVARHSVALPYEELFRCVSSLIVIGGLFSLIYPYEEKDKLISCARSFGFSVCRQTAVFPTERSLPKRVLLEFVKSEAAECLSDELIVELNGRHNYSPAYRLLTQDFYLAF